MKLAVLILLSIPIFTNAQTGVVEGHFFYRSDSADMMLGTITVHNSVPLRGAVADFDGNFKIDSLQAGTYILLVHHDGKPLPDTVKAVTVRPHATTYLEVGFDYLICPERQIKNCPIDGNTKDVIPVHSGLGNRRKQRQSRKGKVFLTGCLWTGCVPTWHCKRHDHQY